MFMDNAYIFQIFLHMGFPTLVTTDQGGEFRSGLGAEMMKELGIRHHFTTPYPPQVPTQNKLIQCGLCILSLMYLLQSIKGLFICIIHCSDITCMYFLLLMSCNVTICLDCVHVGKWIG